MKRITIKDNLEFLKQVSTDIDFTKDDYLGYIKELKEFFIDMNLNQVKIEMMF